MSKIINEDYFNWLQLIKHKIQSSQIKAAIAVNQELIQFYWDLGRMIVEKQEESKWGGKLIEQLSKDLKKGFPDISGFSRTNLYAIRKFYIYFSSEKFKELFPKNRNQAIVPQPVGQLPWGHIRLLLDKTKEREETLFYIEQTKTNNWSREVLAFQIKSQLHKRQGKAITNFASTLPFPQSELAQETIKDPYIFDFLTLSEPYKERDIENQLIENITKFLLELGKGFAFIGRQYHLEIAGNDYYLDLLFYHVILKCYVVIELKNTRFIPEYAGKMNFYLSAVDTIIKRDDDNPTIGILLCRDKRSLEVEFALRDINKPMGVSEFSFIEILPDDLKSTLPTVEEIEKELKNNLL
jgi:predicted nuclease of restriction endonuclease-like (RecB) superfamily